MFRNVGAAIAGIVIAVVVYTAVREIGVIYYAPPEGLDFSDPASVDRYHAQLPLGAYLIVFAKPVVAAFIGTLTACFVGTMNSYNFGAIIGGIVLAYSISLFIAEPHPIWIVLTTLVGIVISTYVAARIAPQSGGGPLELFENEGDSGQDSG